VEGINWEATLLLVLNVVQAMFLAWLGHREVMAGRARRDIADELKEENDARRNSLGG
jgi:hypothetical protein